MEVVSHATPQPHTHTHTHTHHTHTHTHTHTQDLKEVLVESLEQEEAGRNEIEEARIMEMIESLDEKVSIFDLCPLLVTHNRPI